MLALMRREGADAAGEMATGFVVNRLPPAARRALRISARVISGEVPLPRFPATIASAALLAMAGAYGAYAGGHVPEIVKAVTSRAGFAIDKVKVAGNKETSEIDILEKLGLDGWTSEIGFNAQRARDAVATLPWVESASVRKIYPDAVDVTVTEKKPFAIWQEDGRLSLIQANGSVIAPFAGRRPQLPLVVGAGAEKLAGAIVAKVARYPQLAARVKAYIRVGLRRWDLVLDDGVTVKLPETGEDAALADVMRMDREDALLERDILSVDLRLDDRIAIQLTPAALKERQTAIKARDKDIKKRERGA